MRKNKKGFIMSETRTGIIETEPKNEGGRITFILHEGKSHNAIPCMSASDFRGSKPHKGERVILHGEHKRDILTNGETVDFIFSTIQTLV
jgi:hypothetical protein